MTEKKEYVKVPVGPQHPALKEPESFLVSLSGEQVKGVDIMLGYNHRGIEKACEGQSFLRDVYLIERVCGICSHSHPSCFVQAVEKIANLDVPKRGQYIRTLIGELERIHSHLLWLGVAGHEIGFDTLLMYSWRDREVVMDLLAYLTGNRVNYGMNVIGGSRRDISKEQAEEILKAMDKLEEQTKYYIELGLGEKTLIQRLSGVGKLSKEDAVIYGAQGPTARGCGVDKDTRRDDPYFAFQYGEIKFNVITSDHCDVYGRTIVRLLELMEAYSIVRQCIEKMPDGPISVRAPRKIPAGEAVARYEAPRGEDFQYVKSNGEENPERVKLRAPTLGNVQAIAKMMEDRHLADLPIVIAAIDPCFSCTDRSVLVRDQQTASSDLMSWEQLRQFSIDWYKNKGIDPSNIKLKDRK